MKRNIARVFEEHVDFSDEVSAFTKYVALAVLNSSPLVTQSLRASLIGKVVLVLVLGTLTNFEYTFKTMLKLPWSEPMVRIRRTRTAPTLG